MNSEHLKTIGLCILGVLIICTSSPARAEKFGFLGISLGYYNVLEGHSEAADLRINYRAAHSIVFKKLHPWAELNLTSKGNLWLGTGLSYDANLSDRLTLTPSFGVGAYKHTKGDVDLAYPLQFKSQIELGYRFLDNTRLSLAFSHLSNAGLGNRNPGVETLSIYYFMPLNKIF